MPVASSDGVTAGGAWSAAAWVPALLLGAAALLLTGAPPAPRYVAQARAEGMARGMAGPPPQPGLLWPHLAWLLAPVLLVASGVAAALLGGLAAFALRRTVAHKIAARTRDDERSGAAEALAVLSSELRAGRSPDVALEAAAVVASGRFAGALLAAAGSGRIGADPVTCLLRDVDRSAVPHLLTGLAACWQVCAGTGSSLAAAIERLAEGLRAEQGQRLAVEAELAGPRATAGMLALLPIAGIALAAGLGADPLHVLLHTTVGLVCLGLGLCLEALGLWWTSRLVAAAGGSR